MALRPRKREFAVTVGAIFEASHFKLHRWFQAAHLIASSNKGFSAHQIHRIRKLTYKTAWFMCHRHREPMRDGHITVQLGGEGKMVEIDETAARFALTLSQPPLAHVLKKICSPFSIPTCSYCLILSEPLSIK